MFWPPFEDGDLLIVAPVILILMLYFSYEEKQIATNGQRRNRG